ncbi:hypothetical protein PSAC2689_70068 [Paraburkholderia sacchari]
MRFRERGRRAELRAIDAQRGEQLVGREVRGERERQAHRRRELRAVQARSEDIERHVQPRARHGAHSLAVHRIGEEPLQLGDVVGKGFGAGVQVAAQCARRGLVGAGRAAEPQVDAPRVERLERAELLGDQEWRVIGQHDAARPDADRPRAARHMADHDRGGGAGDAGHVVVLGEPVAVVAPALGVLGEIERVAQRDAGVRAGRHRRKVEDGEGNHGRVAFQCSWSVPQAWPRERAGWALGRLQGGRKVEALCQSAPEPADGLREPMRPAWFSVGPPRPGRARSLANHFFQLNRNNSCLYRYSVDSAKALFNIVKNIFQ